MSRHKRTKTRCIRMFSMKCCPVLLNEPNFATAKESIANSNATINSRNTWCLQHVAFTKIINTLNATHRSIG